MLCPSYWNDQSASLDQLRHEGWRQGRSSSSHQNRIKGSKYLATKNLFDNRNGDLLSVTLLAGDVNDDNFCDVLDLDGLITAFGTLKDEIGFDDRADLNSDGAVDVLDLSLFITNFGKEGN